MNGPSSNPRTERLFQASEAVLESVSREVCKAGGSRLQLPDVVGTPDRPKGPEGFSYGEIMEATMFLVRLGYLEMSWKS